MRDQNCSIKGWDSIFSDSRSFNTSLVLYTNWRWVFLGSNSCENTPFSSIHWIRKIGVNVLLVLNILIFLIMEVSSLMPWILLSMYEDLRHMSETSSFKTSVCFSLSSLVINLLWKLSILFMMLSIFSLLTFLRLFSGASLKALMQTSTNLGPYSWMKSLW